MNRSTAWRNAKMVVPIAVVQGAVYFSLNHLPLFAAQPLSPTWIDAAVPFWPWTMWPYLIMIFGSPALPIFVSSAEVFRKTLRAYVAAYVVTFGCHLIWPTQIERPDLPEDGTFQTWAYRTMLSLDTQHSCFPSGHIVGPMILCWALWKDGRPIGIGLLAIFPLVSLTILTTKQHYIWDLLGGYVIGLLAIAWAAWMTRRCSEPAD